MEGFQSLGDVDEDLPDFLLVEVSLLFLVLGDSDVEVAGICELHYNAR